VIECEEKVMSVMEMNWKSQLDFLIPSWSCTVMQHSTRNLAHKDWTTWTTIQALQSIQYKCQVNYFARCCARIQQVNMQEKDILETNMYPLIRKFCENTVNF